MQIANEASFENNNNIAVISREPTQGMHEINWVADPEICHLYILYSSKALKNSSLKKNSNFQRKSAH